MTTTGEHLMISKKQEEDEQFSDLLQTVWSENNVKGKEQLHAHVKWKSLHYRCKYSTAFLDILSFHPLGSTNTNKHCFKIKKQT